MIREDCEQLLSKIKALPVSDKTYGLVHGDVWLENVLVEHELWPTIIDFQDCEKHYYMYDLAVPLYSALEFSFQGKGSMVDYGRSIAKALVEGYSEEHNISEEMYEQLPLFLKLKEMFEYSLMHMYWNKEEITEEQMRIMNLYRLRIEHEIPVISL